MHLSIQPARITTNLRIFIKIKSFDKQIFKRTILFLTVRFTLLLHSTQLAPLTYQSILLHKIHRQTKLNVKSTVLFLTSASISSIMHSALLAFFVQITPNTPTLLRPISHPSSPHTRAHKVQPIKKSFT